MYQAPFVSAREADYFQKKESIPSIVEALKRDLPRFLPQNIFSKYQENSFADFIGTIRDVTAKLLDQGMKISHGNHEGRKKHA